MTVAELRVRRAEGGFRQSTHPEDIMESNDAISDEQRAALERSVRIDTLIAEGKTQDEALAIVDLHPDQVRAFRALALTKEPIADDTDTFADDEGAESLDEVAAHEIVTAADETIDLADIASIAPSDEIVTEDEPVVQQATEEPIAAGEVAKHIETAPAHVELPESKLPIGTVLEKTPTGFKFLLPGRGAIHGHGRSVGGAMLDAKIIY